MPNKIQVDISQLPGYSSLTVGNTYTIKAKAKGISSYTSSNLSTGVSYLKRQRYTITGSITDGTLSGNLVAFSGTSVTVQIVPSAGYAYPSSVIITNADNTSDKYDSATGVVTVSNPTGNVTITAVCIQKLTTPTLSLSGNTLTISDIDTNATAFNLYNGNMLITTISASSPTLNLTTLNLAADTYSFQVCATASGFANSDLSTPAISYVVYSITTSVTDGTASGTSSIQQNSTVVITVTPTSPATLPDTITVNNVAGSSGSTGVTWSYSKANGTISLSNPTANVVIDVVCETASSHSVVISGTDYDSDGGSVKVFDGSSKDSPLIWTSSTEGSFSATVTIESGYLYITVGITGDWGGYIGDPSGGVTLVDDFGDAGLFHVSGDGALSDIVSSSCVIKGTPITLSDGSYKNVEDIDYDDILLVWNFDEGRFDSAKPLWIMQAKKSIKYNHLVFDDGSELNTVNQHRIFNAEKGKFTYPMTDDTPIGTTTLNDKGELVHLISKEVVEEEVEYYNLITDYHMNYFAGHILTSCRLNNIYPIKDLKFVKDEVRYLPYEAYDVPLEYYKGLRLSEQPEWETTSSGAVYFGDNSYDDYVNRLISMKK